MASETPLKRQREDETQDIQDETKRQKSYNDILSLLEEEEEEPETQDISSIITTLQQELSSSSSSSDDPRNSCTHALENPLEDCFSDSSTASSKTADQIKEDQEENDGIKVMRHLLEASDDELGLPNSAEEQLRLDVHNYNVGENLFSHNNNLDCYSFGDGLWEFEDEAANYYTMLQSELFM